MCLLGYSRHNNHSKGQTSWHAKELKEDIPRTVRGVYEGIKGEFSHGPAPEGSMRRKIQLIKEHRQRHQAEAKAKAEVAQIDGEEHQRHNTPEGLL